MTNNSVNKEAQLYLGIKVSLGDGSQPFEMVNDNSGTGWFAPSRYLESLPGVIRCELTDTTSSAGDWSGWFAVKSEDGSVALVAFSQENNAFRSPGYTLWTSDKPFAIVDDESDIDEVVNEWINETYS